MTAADTARPGDRPLVLRNVTVVDTRDGTLAPGLDVFIAGGVIAEIATADASAWADAAATDTEVVDGSGQYLVSSRASSTCTRIRSTRSTRPAASS
jgi:hypothetical protein